MTTVRAYHFVGRKLPGGRPVPKDGETLYFKGKPILFHRGLRAFLHPFDAMWAADGHVLCIVEIGGNVVQGGGEIAGTERTIVARLDATKLLMYFARMQAVSVLRNWLMDPRDELIDYLMTGRPSLIKAAHLCAKKAVTMLRGLLSESTTGANEVRAALDAARSAAVATTHRRPEHSAAAAHAMAIFSVCEKEVFSGRAAVFAARKSLEASARNMFAELVDESFVRLEG